MDQQVAHFLILGLSMLWNFFAYCLSLCFCWWWWKHEDKCKRLNDIFTSCMKVFVSYLSMKIQSGSKARWTYYTHSKVIRCSVRRSQTIHMHISKRTSQSECLVFAPSKSTSAARGKGDTGGRYILHDAWAIEVEWHGHRYGDRRIYYCISICKGRRKEGLFSQGERCQKVPLIK
jgi:hypothetical protein